MGQQTRYPELTKRSEPLNWVIMRQSESNPILCIRLRDFIWDIVARDRPFNNSL
jgi:hypothetical protein